MPIQEFLRNHCPNIPALRRWVSRERIRALNRHLMSEEDLIAGEQSEERKQDLAQLWAAKDPEYHRKTENKLQGLLETVWKDRQDHDALITDVVFCRYAYGFLPEEYLCFGLENRDMNGRLSFVSDIQRIRYDCRMSDMADSRIFKDKAQTYRFFEPYYKRDIVALQRQSDQDAFFTFIQKHPRFLRKEVFNSIGQGIELIDLGTCGRSPTEVFRESIRHGKVVLEELVEQSGEMAAFNASSVNTVRCITLNTRRGIDILCTVLRVGRDGHFVDNAGFGGLFAGIEEKTGIVNTDGCSKINERFAMDPDTGKTFKGFQLPDWQALIDMCCEMARKIPTVRYIGWDMAHTDQGWIVIEGNNCPQIGMVQIARQKGIRAQLENSMMQMDLMA